MLLPKKNLLFAVLLICGCEGSARDIPIGSGIPEIANMIYGPAAKEEKVDPLISYGSLRDKLPGAEMPGYSNLEKIPVGEKLLDGMIPSSGFKAEKVVGGQSWQAYEDITNAYTIDFGPLIPSGGGGGGMPEPGRVPFPLSDLNTDPYIASPFPGIESVPKAPKTEFFFDEAQKRPAFFD